MFSSGESLCNTSSSLILPALITAICKDADLTDAQILPSDISLQIIAHFNPKNFLTLMFIFRSRNNIQAILLYTTILLYAHLKNIALKISRRYLQETFSEYFSVVPHGCEYFAYTCKRYDLEHEIFLTRKILSFLCWICCVSGEKSTPILPSARALVEQSLDVNLPLGSGKQRNYFKLCKYIDKK